MVTPWSRWIEVSTRPSCRPRILRRAVSNTSTTVTSRPSVRRDAVTSAPMNPIPTTTAWVAEAAAARIRSASATVRSWNTPSRSLPGTGSERLRTPVATRQPSNARRSPSVSVSVRAPASSACTRVPGRVSTSCSRHHASGRMLRSSRGTSPRRYVFDSGGRWYGKPGSSPSRTSRPSNPSSRSVAAAVPPARAAPTTTKVRSRGTYTSIWISPSTSRDGYTSIGLVAGPSSTAPVSIENMLP